MPTRLASPVTELKPHYPVVVVGSGYGGAIAASRLSRAGQKVCVLERGKEFQPGEYPDTEPEMLRELQVDLPSHHLGNHTGLYDFRLNPDMCVLVGCGLGGTSLINANVSIEADPRVFEDPVWPAALRADLGTRMKEGYARAREMLKPAPFPRPVDELRKLKALEVSAQALGEKFYKAEINVNFQAAGPNHVGVEQQPCNLCGDCVSGCNHGSKNTTLMNYLPDAKNHGAEIFTQVSVHHLERGADGKWRVHCQLLEAGREKFDAPELVISADLVVLSAGTLGSTEILMRSRERGLRISDQIGQRFSGNGDVLGFSYNTDREINGIGCGERTELQDMDPVGPCITGIIDTRRADRPLGDGLIIEEGSIPGAMGGFLPMAFALAAKTVGHDTTPDVPSFLRESAREAESVVGGARVGAIRNSQTFLVMAHDGAKGRMKLADDRVRIEWKGVSGEALYHRINDTLEKATEPLGGIYVKNPLSAKWAGQDLITVHPLGGCAMGEDSEHGVVNHKGQVFSDTRGAAVYEGLYVADGSIIPRPLGMNPLLTISALAEREMALIARDRGWVIDYALKPVAAKPAAQPKLALQFTETMRGYVSTKILDTQSLDDYRSAERQGQKDGSPFMFVLTISTDDLEDMLTNSTHPAKAVGTVTAPALSSKPLLVTDGVFNLFTDDPSRPETKKMLYKMTLTSEEGNVYAVDGFKVIHKDAPLALDVWPDTTTLYLTVRENDPKGRVVAKGVLQILPEDFAKQLSSVEVRNARSTEERLKAAERFGAVFAGMLYDVYGGVMVSYDTFKPATARKKRPLRTPAPRVYPFKTADGVTLMMTRYTGGKKGPVILGHGLGVSGLIFALDTVDTNLVEYLCANGYDVWNLEHRASIDLPTSKAAFTLDEVARYDYPAAVEKVKAETGAATVQIIGHCFGAQTLTVSLLGGWLKDVRSVVISQISAHVRVPPLTALKSGLFVPELLDKLGVDSLTAYAGRNPSWLDKLYDRAINLQPIAQGEGCKSPVCHRITFMYGHLYDHKNLNEATHATLHETFGIANIRAMEHLALCARRHQIVNHDGGDDYLPHPERMKLPVAFIHGAENRCFLPESTRLTYEWLRDANGSENYKRHLVPAYGHIDCWMGNKAYSDVYPYALEHLDATQS